MTDTWNDRDDFEQSRADDRILTEHREFYERTLAETLDAARAEQQHRWTWPAPRITDAATCDQLEAANLDPGARDLDGLTPLERAEIERDMARDALDRAEHDLERVRTYLRSVTR